MTTRGKARDCARVVIMQWANPGRNSKYEMAYWGKAMRAHVAQAAVDGEVLGPDIAGQVAKAEEVLARECDGQDCSFKG